MLLYLQLLSMVSIIGDVGRNRRLKSGKSATAQSQTSLEGRRDEADIQSELGTVFLSSVSFFLYNQYIQTRPCKFSSFKIIISKFDTIHFKTIASLQRSEKHRRHVRVSQE